MAVAKVIIELSLDKEFDYLIPEPILPLLKPGMMVTVPFGTSTREGYVLAITDTSQYTQGKLKSILKLCESRTNIPENLLELGQWMAEYYCCSQEQSIRALLPAAVRSGKIKPKTRNLYRIEDIPTAEAFIATNANKSSATGRINLLKALLANGPTPTDILKTLVPNFSTSSLNTLVQGKLVSLVKEHVRRDAFGSSQVVQSFPLAPTAEQQHALDLIQGMLQGKTSSRTLLLHGVTNSGKTEVYLQAIAMTLELGKSAIVLVPEISLTPQTVRRFRARFGDGLSILHSRLSNGERFDEWNRINSGDVQIAIGARSALFAPFRNLGLIIVDEEHESSYKQSEAPRYSARDVAVMRGKLEGAAVILGSATPSAESSYNASTGKFLLAKMNSQVEDKLAPLVTIVDQRLSTTPTEGKTACFSKILIDAVHDRLYRGEQSIIFLNRRGYARVMICEECGFEARCPDCSVNYTYSKLKQNLSCHLCGNIIPAYLECPQCQSKSIRYSGVGTEKIENIAKAVFHPARIARMDSDTMRGADDYETVLEKFRRGELDILIGTQMIAKGLHFPNVTLVGIVNADLGLAMPDFRAPERTFQLITQVAGRAGRGDIRGEVIIQTFNPDNETIQYASQQDFEGFSEFDLEFRKMLAYPPYTHLIVVHFRGEDEQILLDYANAFTTEIKRYGNPDVNFSGPSPAPIERIKGKFRYMLIIRGNKLKILRQALRELILHGKPPKDVEVYADVDAQSLL